MCDIATLACDIVTPYCGKCHVEIEIEKEIEIEIDKREEIDIEIDVCTAP